MIRLSQPQSEDDWRRARRLVEAYVASLHLDLSFQNIAYEIGHLKDEYASPRGAFLLAELDGADVGCIGVRRFSGDTGEIKRLYVAPSARGHGVGRLLAEKIVSVAKSLGYARLRLDTLPEMKAAQTLYESLGFKPIAPYRFNPVEGTAYLELTLPAGC